MRSKKVTQLTNYGCLPGLGDNVSYQTFPGVVTRQSSITSYLFVKPKCKKCLLIAERLSKRNERLVI